MARVVLASRVGKAVLAGARQILSARGHTVRVVSDGQELLKIILTEQPDIVFTGMTLEDSHSPFEVISPWEVRKEAVKRIPGIETRFIQTTVLKEDGEVGLDWDDPLVDAYYLLPSVTMETTNLLFEWHVAVTVEQMIYRPNLRPDRA